MNVEETSIPGVLLVPPEHSEDERGSFTTLLRTDELGAKGVTSDVRQVAISKNPRRGTLRGLHFQRAPHAQAKFVRCLRGGVFDVVVDLRATSSTFARSVSIELHPDGPGVYVPVDCAHGFITLCDASEVLYHLSTPGVPSSAGGIRWNDAGLDIEWPLAPAVMSLRDQTWADYDWSGARAL